MFIRYLLLFCFIFFLNTVNIWANSIENLENTLSEYEIEYQNKVFFGNSFEIDISNLNTSLEKKFPDIALEYVWEIFSSQPQTGSKISTTFETSGEKAIELNIFTTQEWDDENIEKVLLYSYDLSVFVYKQSLPILIDSEVNANLIEEYIASAEDLGVYIYKIWEVDEEELSWEEIVSSITNYELSFPESSNYIAIWGEKEFIFSALSKIRATNPVNSSLNVILISAYNTSILKKYITNSVVWKDFITDGFIIDESLRFQTLKNPQNIEILKKEVENNNYRYTPINEGVSIHKLFFVSKFINNLSNNWISTTHIYIILLLPIFLTIVGISKHMIWISTLWNIIPVFITLLFLEIWVPFTLLLIWFLIVVNMLISKFINKYILLYTPKVTFITIINLLVFMLFFQGLQSLDIIAISIDNIIYMVLFFILSEKLVTIITSKEFREYKKNLAWTLLVSLLCYMLFEFNALLVFLTAYPETLMVLVPLNFFLGRFTWLRITEYLRFREIIKSVEE
jgi:hypothetical protein